MDGLWDDLADTFGDDWMLAGLISIDDFERINTDFIAAMTRIDLDLWSTPDEHPNSYYQAWTDSYNKKYETPDE